MNFGQNLYQWFLSNAQSLVLMAIVVIGIYLGFKREFSKLIGFLVVALIAVGLVFNAGGVKDVLLELFNKIMMVNPVSLSSLKQMPGKKEKLLRRCLEIPVFGTLVYHMVVSRDAVNNEFIENYAFDPFHPDRDLQDAYYEAAHRGGCYAKNVYANKASKYMNIDITRGLKEIDNSLYIVEGEAENNGEAIIEAYQNVNPSVEAVMIKETKHFPHVEAPEQFLEQVGIFF